MFDIGSSSKGQAGFIFPFGEQLVGTKYDDVSVQFQYDVLNYEFDLRQAVTTGTGGAIVNENSYLKLTANAGGDITVTSKDSIHYRPGHSGYADFTLSYNGVGVVKGGCFDELEQNGFQVRLDTDGLGFCYLKDGVAHNDKGELGYKSVSLNEFPLNNLNIENETIFRIIYGFLGVANPVLFVKFGIWYPVCMIWTESQLDGVHVDTPVFSIGVKAENGASLKTGSWNGGTIGIPTSAGGRPFAFPNQMLISGTDPIQGRVNLIANERKVLAIFRSKDQYSGKINSIKATYTNYSFSVDTPPGSAVGVVAFQLVKVRELSGVDNWVDMNTISSSIEFDHTPDTGAIMDVTDGTPIINETVPYASANKGGSTGVSQIDAASVGAIANRGDAFAVIAKELTGNPVSVRFTLNHRETF